MAEKVFGSLKGKGLLLYGAGQMARLTAQNFLGKGADKLYIVNRHLERAQELAGDVGGQAVHYKESETIVDDVDIDIAVPRDISPDAAAIDGVTLYNIDDLEDIVHDNEAARQREAVAAKVIVDEAVTAMVERYRYLSVRPAGRTDAAPLRQKGPQQTAGTDGRTISRRRKLIAHLSPQNPACALAAHRRSGPYA